MQQFRRIISASRSAERGGGSRLVRVLSVLGSSYLLRAGLVLAAVVGALVWYQNDPGWVHGEDLSLGIPVAGHGFSSLENNTRLSQNFRMVSKPSRENYFFRSYSGDAGLHYLLSGPEVVLVQARRQTADRTSVVEPLIATRKGLGLGAPKWRMYLLYGLPEQIIPEGVGDGYMAVYRYPDRYSLSFVVNEEGEVSEMAAAKYDLADLDR